MSIPRMRTAPECIKMLTEADKDCAFTLRALRRMIANNEIPVVCVASRKLINYDLLISKLADGVQAPPAPEYGVIRKIESGR